MSNNDEEDKKNVEKEGRVGAGEPNTRTSWPFLLTYQLNMKVDIRNTPLVSEYYISKETYFL